MSALDKCAISLMLEFKLFFRELFFDEEGDVSIVTMVVLIGIAVLLAVFFRKQVQSLIEILFGTIEGTATDAVSN